MSCFKLGLCSVTFRKKTIEEIAEIAEIAGVDFIEWGADVHVKNLDEAKKAKAICYEKNIRISSYGSYFNAISYDEGEWEKVCAIAKEMEAGSVRIWLGKKDSEKTDSAEYKTLVNNLNKMCETAKKYDLLVCPECHDNTFNNNTDSFLKIAKEINKENFRTYFQSRYFRKSYDLDRIERTYDYIENVHISYRDLKKEQMFRTKDRKYIDTILKTLDARKYTGIVMIEFVIRDSERQLMKDINRLKKYMSA